MKKYAILRWGLLGILFVVMYLISLVIYPIIFIIRKFIRKYNNLWVIYILWLFLNDSEDNTIDDDFGPQWFRNKINMPKLINDYNFFQKLYISYRWNAIRNSHWNFKLMVAPKIGTKTNINLIVNEVYNKDTLEPLKNTLMACNIDNYWGKNYFNYKINGYKYFLYSSTKIFKGFWWNKKFPWIIYTKLIRNIQLGNNNVRYIYKHRINKLK